MRTSTAVVFLSGVFASLSHAATDTTRVLVPGAGYRNISTVHEIPAGGRVAHVDNTTIHILTASGSLHKAVTHTGTGTRVKAAATPAADTAAAMETGWVAYAGWLNTPGADPIATFTTTWTVPSEPETNNGQTVFLFNSIEPESGDAILQPVLQYGGSAAGGGAYWAVASWYLVGDNTFFSSLVPTQAGVTLTGVITLTSSSNGSYDYTSTFTGIDGTSVDATGSSELAWATETLESYSITAASDYPAGNTTFSAIDLTLASGAVPDVHWDVTSDTADEITTTVDTDGATDAEITIAY